jgi:hypothetical protein
MNTDYAKALLKRFSSPEYIVLFEVPDTTGSGASRRMDAMVMGLWPSRGLILHGIEVKARRSDWVRELNDPAKQERHARFVDAMWLLTCGDDVAKLEEIPPLWGWMHLSGKKLVTKKAAPPRQAEPLPRGLLAALLRAAADSTEAALETRVNAMVDDRKAQMDRTLKQERERREATQKWAHDEAARVYRSVKAQVEWIEEALGFPIFQVNNYEDQKRLQVLGCVTRNLEKLPGVLRAVQEADAQARHGYVKLAEVAKELEAADLTRLVPPR